MTNDKLEELYFDWLCSISFTNETERLDRTKLLRKLYETDFIAILLRDKNRILDGYELRYRFLYDNNMDYLYEDNQFLQYKECSILEMMVALSLRCEESIMADPDIGDRVSYWFRTMITNLGLYYMTDYFYDENTVNDILIKFINRDYSKDGSGGLFAIKNFKYDLRKIEIWYQMNWYLDNLLPEKEK